MTSLLTSLARNTAGGQAPYFSTASIDVNTSNGAGVANSAYLYRFRVATTQRWSGVAILVGTQSGNVDVGLYTSDGTTLTRVVSAGSTACPSGAPSTVNFSAAYTLSPGFDYYLAFAVDNATATFNRATVGGFSTEPGKRSRSIATSFPLPASIAMSGTAAATIIFALTVS